MQVRNGLIRKFTRSSHRDFRRFGRLVAGTASVATLALGLVAVAPVNVTSASATGSQTETSPCATAITAAPSGPATVSAASTPYGRVLVVGGSGDQAGCSLYVVTSDELHAMTGAPYACSDNTNPTGAPCDTVLWPALLTSGAPIAGPGVNPTLLGTVTRTDMSFGGSVQQVTYGGLPLYRFFLDEVPGETEGANLFDPVTSPTGIWYLVDPSRGLPARGQVQLQLESAPVNGVGPNQTVLSVSMNDTFSLFPDANFPVYTLSTDSGHTSACQGQCALEWQPVLTSGPPVAGPNVDQHALGTIVRSDGTHQVTYDGQPLYLFSGDAYIPVIPGVSGPASINGADLVTPWGVFNTVPPLS
jgi:predicted lipoprotein with Yx(FWY)xxD motif